MPPKKKVLATSTPVEDEQVEEEEEEAYITPDETAKTKHHEILPQESRLLIVRMLLSHQWKPEGIAEYMHCSANTVYRVKRNLLKYGSATAPRQKPHGPRRKITPEMEKEVLEMLERTPDMPLKQIAAFLKEKYDVQASPTGISRFLKTRAPYIRAKPKPKQRNRS